jgi:hypothetical protein
MSAPGYWMYETSGELRPAVERYLKQEKLSAGDIDLLRVYLRQWIDSPVWDTNPHLNATGRKELMRLRELARVLTNVGAIEAWLSLAVDAGMDPL